MEARTRKRTNTPMIILYDIRMGLGGVEEWRRGLFFFFSSRRRHTRFDCDWSSDVCSSDLVRVIVPDMGSGYGGKHRGDAAVEAARLARGAGRPVKLVWTREEEFTWAYFRQIGRASCRERV